MCFKQFRTLYVDNGNENIYGGNQFFALSHYEQHQYPDKFPCEGDPSKCDPPTDKKGSLGLYISSIPPTGFPSASTYWEIRLVSPVLSSLFQNKSEFEAYLGQKFTNAASNVEANMFLNIDGSKTPILATGGFIPVSKGKWTKLSANFNIPPGTYVRNIIIQLRGFCCPNFTEGGIYVDHVAAVK
jgi:hypothetical protein